MFLPEPPVSPWATVLPLVLVMGVCMVKQAGDNGDGDSGGTMAETMLVMVVVLVLMMMAMAVAKICDGDMMLKVHCDIVVMFNWWMAIGNDYIGIA